MATMERTGLRPPKGFRSRETASFVAQLDDLSGRLREDTRGLTRAELEWQPAPGMNTIGMLLAHNAIVEVFWIQLAVERRAQFDVRGVLGIGDDDDGMPTQPRGGHPTPLHGKSLAFYDGLLRKARANTKRWCRTLTDRQLATRFRRRRRNGRLNEVEVRWVLYHIVEHYAGHYYQINTLRHQFRTARRGR